MSVLDSPGRLAKLLLSVNVPGTARPLSPPDVATEIHKLLTDLGDDRDELVRRLPIGQDLTRQFLRLLDLPPQIRGMVVWGESRHETGAIGFSVASRIASLNDHDDMLRVAGTITEMPRPVTAEEIKGIVSLKKRNPDKAIEECLSEVLNVTRPVTITHHMFLSGLDPDIVRSLKRRARESDKSPHELAADSLRRVFPSDLLKSVRVFSDCIRLSLARNGTDFISKYSESRGIPMQEALNHMLGSERLRGG